MQHPLLHRGWEVAFDAFECVVTYYALCVTGVEDETIVDNARVANATSTSTDLW